MDEKSKLIGRLCWELSSEKAENELDAIEEKILKLNKVIDTKLSNAIDATQDIEQLSTLQIIREEYLREQKEVVG